MNRIATSFLPYQPKLGVKSTDPGGDTIVCSKKTGKVKYGAGGGRVRWFEDECGEDPLGHLAVRMHRQRLERAQIRKSASSFIDDARRTNTAPEPIRTAPSSCALEQSMDIAGK